MNRPIARRWNQMQMPKLHTHLVVIAVALTCQGCFLFGGGGKKSDTGNLDSEDRPMLVVRPARNVGDPTQPRTTLSQMEAAHAAEPVAIKQGGLETMLNRVCVVHFRRDVLGLAPATTQPAAKTPSAIGVLSKVTDEWLVLENGGTSRWIPRSVVLEVEFQPTGQGVP